MSYLFIFRIISSNRSHIVKLPSEKVLWIIQHQILIELYFVNPRNVKFLNKKTNYILGLFSPNIYY